MSINIKKTKCMLFGTKQIVNKMQKVKLQLNDVNIQQVSSYKYLGMTLDKNLNYFLHLNQLIRKVSHKMYQLKRVHSFLTEKSSLMIYKSFILPHLEYGNILYQNSNSKLLGKMQRLQNQCLKICLNLDKRHSDTNDVHKRSKLNLLKDRREIQLLKIMYLSSKKSKYLEIFNDDRLRTRIMSVPKFKYPTDRNNLAKKSIIYTGSIFWNEYNSNVKKITDKDTFNSKMKCILKEKLQNY